MLWEVIFEEVVCIIPGVVGTLGLRLWEMDIWLLGSDFGVNSVHYTRRGSDF